MKILHTSDWHLGQSLGGYDRTEEFKDFFRQIEGIAAAEKPDVLVVAGDIYDNSMPSAAVQNLYVDSMLSLHRACPSMQVVVTAGNHDSGLRLEIGKDLWGAFGIHVIGGLRRVERRLPSGEVRMETDLERHIVEIVSDSGQLKGYVAAVPFVHAVNFPDLTGDTPAGERPRRFFQALLDAVSRRNEKGLPVVMTAHLALLGGDFSWHASAAFRKGVIGGEECMGFESMGTGFDYLALGHIHKAQAVPGTGGRARYSGSVVPVGFEETQPHSVSLVEIDQHGSQPEVELFPLRTLLPVLTLPEQPLPFEEALASLSALPAEQACYLRLQVKMKDFLPANSAERVVAALEGKKARYCYIQPVFEKMEAESGRRPDFTAAQISRQSPVELAKAYYREKQGTEMDADLTGLLEQVCRELEQEKEG